MVFNDLSGLFHKLIGTVFKALLGSLLFDGSGLSHWEGFADHNGFGFPDLSCFFDLFLFLYRFFGIFGSCFPDHPGFFDVSNSGNRFFYSFGFVFGDGFASCDWSLEGNLSVFLFQSCFGDLSGFLDPLCTNHRFLDSYFPHFAYLPGLAHRS